jgi:hypothetical protein
MTLTPILIGVGWRAFRLLRVAYICLPMKRAFITRDVNNNEQFLTLYYCCERIHVL